MRGGGGGDVKYSGKLASSRRLLGVECVVDPESGLCAYDCEEHSYCSGNGQCNTTAGVCMCEQGWAGPSCAVGNYSLWTSCKTAAQTVDMAWGCGNLTKESNRLLKVHVSMCVDKQQTVEKFAELISRFNTQNGASINITRDHSDCRHNLMQLCPADTVRAQAGCQEFCPMLASAAQQTFSFCSSDLDCPSAAAAGGGGSGGGGGGVGGGGGDGGGGGRSTPASLRLVKILKSHLRVKRTK